MSAQPIPSERYAQARYRLKIASLLVASNDKMKLKPIFILSLLFLARSLIGQTNDSTFIVGTNLFPIVSTQFDVFYEKQLNGYMTIHTGLGYVFNGPDSPHPWRTNIDLDKSSGGFISIGLNGHLKNKRISPLIGLRVVNSISYEEGMIQIDPFDRETTEHFTSTGYTLGMGGILGLTFKVSRRIYFDLGIQKSYLLIDGLCDFHSYAPGMGVILGPSRIQLIGQLKYRIEK